MADHVIIHSSELLTGRGIEAKHGRYPKEEDLDRIIDGAIVAEKGKKIKWVGKTSDLPKRYVKLKKTNLEGKRAILPGLIDCHTHLVFAGNRADEFAERCAGITYEEIAKKGGGILSTVKATRVASKKDLEKLAIQRVAEAFERGVRTLEIKSGYGLDFDCEMKILEVIKSLQKKFKEMTFCATFLGAHAFPPESERGKDEYFSDLVSKMLPWVSKKKLASACDIFIDRGYFNIQQGERLLSRAKELGLKVKVHGDELSDTGSADFAARMGALSVDHLLHVSGEGIRALSQSETVAVLLPGTAFFLKEAYAPARKLIDSGVRVAVASDFNPGSCMCNNLPLVMTIAALQMKMSRSEIFASVTYNAAKALGLEKQKGSLGVGKDSDLYITPFSRFDELYYRFGW